MSNPTNRSLSGPLQGHAVIEPVRLFGRHGNPRNDKSNPMSTIRVHNEHLTVQLKQRVERRVPPGDHACMVISLR